VAPLKRFALLPADVAEHHFGPLLREEAVFARMARLRELFGAALDDPEGRLELELALRVRPYAQLPVDRDGGLNHSQDSLSNS
jgi:hypothetical protein